MKAIFLDEIYISALKAHGVDLKNSHGLTNPLDKFSHNDLVIITHQTSRLLACALFSNMDMFTAPCDYDVVASEPNEMNWDVFLKEGIINPMETKNRIQNLNCVLRGDTLYFFEDDENTDNVSVNALRALSGNGQLDEVLQTKLWSTFVESC